MIDSDTDRDDSQTKAPRYPPDTLTRSRSAPSQPEGSRRAPHGGADREEPAPGMPHGAKPSCRGRSAIRRELGGASSLHARNSPSVSTPRARQRRPEAYPCSASTPVLSIISLELLCMLGDSTQSRLRRGRESPIPVLYHSPPLNEHADLRGQPDWKIHPLRLDRKDRCNVAKRRQALRRSHPAIGSTPWSILVDLERSTSIETAGNRPLGRAVLD